MYLPPPRTSADFSLLQTTNVPRQTTNAKIGEPQIVDTFRPFKKKPRERLMLAMSEDDLNTLKPQGEGSMHILLNFWSAKCLIANERY